jgi:hypothetical protein
MTNEEVHHAASQAQDIVQKYLFGKQGFLGASIAKANGKLVIQVRWLELTPIAPLPASVHDIGILVMPCKRQVASETSPLVSGPWLDSWREAGSEAWHDYTDTLRSYW